jgi:pancreatic triacylglycerol lipase
LKTKFIIHGFLDYRKKKWIGELKDALLKVENLNVIVVDWSKGNGFPYTQATANTQIVGAEIAKLINSFVDKKNAKMADFHLIGHSLGSHVAGYAGQYLNGKIARITGLDPAGPYFEFTHTMVRLDPRYFSCFVLVCSIYFFKKNLSKIKNYFSKK